MKVFLTILLSLLLSNSYGGNAIDWVLMTHDSRTFGESYDFITAATVDPDTKQVHMLMVGCDHIALTTTIDSPYGDDPIYLKFDDEIHASASPRQQNITVLLIKETIEYIKKYNSLYMHYKNLYGKVKSTTFDLRNFSRAYEQLNCKSIEEA